MSLSGSDNRCTDVDGPSIKSDTTARSDDVQTMNKDTVKVNQETDSICSNYTTDNENSFNYKEIADVNYQNDFYGQDFDIDKSHTDINKDSVTVIDSNDQTSKSSGNGVVCYTNWYNCKETNDKRVLCAGSKSYNKYWFNHKTDTDYDSVYKSDNLDVDKKGKLNIL